MTPHRIPLGALVLTLAGLPPGLALAQPAPPPAATALDAITTTATRTPQVAGDVAAPVSVVTREEIRRLQPQNLNDLLRSLPGVEADGIPRPSVQEPQIRGLGADRVIVTLDGVRQNFNSGHRGRVFFEPELLRQVDVLRGPASMLYGSGALGGVVALRTIEAQDVLRPGKDIGAFLSQGYDTNGGRWRSSGAAAFRHGGFDGMVAGARNAGNNLVDGAGQTIPFSDPTTETLIARLGWQPVEGLRIAASVIDRNEDQIIPSAANTAATSDITSRDLSARQYQLTFEYAPPGFALVDLRGQIYSNSIDFTEVLVNPATGRRDETNLDTVGFNVQNTSRFALGAFGQHALTIGVDGYRDEQQGLRDGAPRTQFPRAEQDVIGLFVQDEITFGRLTTILGLRYDSYDQSASGQPSRSNDRLSPRFTIAYRLTEWLQPFITYAEAYRAPNLSQLYNSGVHFPIAVRPRPIFNVFVPNPDLRPETSRSIEAGVNLRFRDVATQGDSLRLRASVFRNDLDDFIETVVTATTTEQRNVTDARIEGFELEALYESGSWFGAVGGSALRGENRTNDQPLSLIPAHKVSLSGGRRFIESGITAGARLQLVAEQSRKPRDTQTGLQPVPTEGYALADLFASWQPPEGPLSALRLDALVSNLFDTSYRRLAWDSGSTRTPFYDVGRNVQLRATLSF
jgi:hemoglobin/transferrin/lactoferrin receptor protein